MKYNAKSVMKYIGALLASLVVQQTVASQAIVNGIPAQIKLVPTGYDQVPAAMLEDLSIGSIIYLMKVSPEAKEILSGTTVGLVSLDSARVRDGGGVVRKYSLAGFEKVSDDDLIRSGVSYGLKSPAFLVSQCTANGRTDWNKTEAAGVCGIRPTDLQRIKTLLNYYVFAPSQQGGSPLSSGKQQVVR